MSRNADEDGGATAVRHMSRIMQAWNQGEVSTDLVARSFQELRAGSPAAGPALDEMLLQQVEQTRNGLLEARDGLDKMQGLIDRYGNAPLIPATYLYGEQIAIGEMAVVANGAGRRAVALGDGVDGDSLRCGDPIYLSADQSILVARAASPAMHGGEIATFERYTDDGRIVLKLGADELVVVHAAAAVTGDALKEGDLVRWDRSARVGIERIPPGESSNPFLLQEVEELPLHRIGGQKDNLARIKDALLLSIIYPERARRYDVLCSNNILLFGPPGNGKTYMTRAVFSEIRRVSGKKVYLAVVKASGWSSKWYGETEGNISSLFANMRKAADAGHIAVLFIDEIDSVGRTRGSAVGHYDDKALNTLLNEMNGYKDLPNVSIVGACNRKDLLDSALLSRFGEHILISRPDLQSAREIFSVHLAPELPYDSPTNAAEGTRDEIIDRAVSRLYAPNADADICVLKLRDGRTRPVAARELVSGRLIQQISQSVKRRALRRDLEEQGGAIRLADMEDALVETRERLVSTLTPYNVHNHLDSLSEDEVVLAVEPIRRRVQQPQRYMNVA